MTERRHRGEGSPGRRPAEGVRIIGAEEAQAALDAGEATGRRPEDEPRFGDVPPVPQGPRPAHRFPLPDTVDPAEAVSLPPPAPGYSPSGEPPAAGTWGDPPAAGARPPEDPPAPHRSPPGPDDEWAPHDPTTELGMPGSPRPAQPAPPEEGITVTGGAAEMPHWTDPPTGEVPRILATEHDESDQDDLAAWQALGTHTVRWRDEDDWDDAQGIGEITGDVEPVGALDQSRSEHSDLYSFDEDFERVEAERSRAHGAVEPEAASTRPATGRARVVPQAHAQRGRPTAGRAPGRLPGGRPPARDDLGSRVVVGIGLVVLLAIAYAVGAKALMVLAAIILVAAAAEAYGMMQRSGFRPATLLGLVATAGVVLGAYWQGLAALPLAVVLVFAGSMMWYLMRIVEARPLANVAVTTMVFVWVGVLGSYASILVRAPHGKGLLLGPIAIAVVADIGAFVVGRWVGSRPVAESISPSKTVEGFLGGLVAAIIAGAIVGKELTPWGGMKHGLVLGVVVGLVAAAGDLFESMIKRDLSLKDSGSTLLGHGGLLDRFDSVLLALPAAYYIAWLFSIVK